MKQKKGKTKLTEGSFYFKENGSAVILKIVYILAKCNAVTQVIRISAFWSGAMVLDLRFA